MEDTVKKWYLSLTLWFNVLALLVAVAVGFGFGEFTPDPWVVPVAAGIIAIINLILRAFKTSTKLTA